GCFENGSEFNRGFPAWRWKTDERAWTSRLCSTLPLGRFPPRNRESRTKAASPCPLVCFPAPRGESSVKLAPVFETSSFFRSDLNEESVRQRHSFPARNSNAGPGSGVSTKDAARDHH